MITPATELPDVTAPATISAFSELHEVTLDGVTASASPSLETAFDIQADDVSVRNLTIIRWDTGVAITNADRANIANNLIGTDNAAALGLGNSVSGITVEAGSDDAVIENNAIAGNGQQGIRAFDTPVTGLVIRQNRIGPNWFGTVAIPNAEGIGLRDVTNATVGGDGIFDGNVISGNTATGLTISSSTTGTVTGTRVAGNKFGTTTTGNTALQNLLEIRRLC